MKKMEPSLGLAIHSLSEEMDAGPICWTKEIRNEDHFTHNYVQYLFSNLMLEGVHDIIARASSGILQSQAQDESKARWHSKPSLRDVLINWNEMSTTEICSLVRACSTWNVGAITLYQGMELKIVEASLQPADKAKIHTPGTISSLSDTVNVSCGNGHTLAVHYLSLNGIPIAGRHAGKYGIQEGERFTYPMD
jgi:methionyl-tRNA formyltransferase